MARKLFAEFGRIKVLDLLRKYKIELFSAVFSAVMMFASVSLMLFGAVQARLVSQKQEVAAQLQKLNENERRNKLMDAEFMALELDSRIDSLRRDLALRVREFAQIKSAHPDIDFSKAERIFEDLE